MWLIFGPLSSIIFAMEKCISETIAEALEADLASGCWKTGERLPSVDELRARFGAGEYAVRRAIRRLARTRWGLTQLYSECFMTKPANIGMSVIIC